MDGASSAAVELHDAQLSAQLMSRLSFRINTDLHSRHDDGWCVTACQMHATPGHACILNAAFLYPVSRFGAVDFRVIIF